ncbi:MAG: F0F1 ATP synthase subunit B [Bacteroidota bacterium]|nr:F0F1 ATP synthase subunit B [Bacteroidota bacterium]
MQINWFTVIAQVINFLILVWLLKRFLYKPVLNAIDEREKKIADQLNDAEAKKAEAQKERDEFEQKNEDFDKEREARLDKVQEDAKAEKQRLFEEVRTESNTLRAKYETALKQEEQNIADTIKRKTQDEVFAIASKALSDLASASLEEQLIKMFVKRIQDLNEEEKKNFREAFSNSNTTIIIKSAFELQASSKENVEKAINEITGKETNFQYQPVPELVSGIEIDAENYKLSWNIESYLEALKKNITEPLVEMHKEKENAAV